MAEQDSTELLKTCASCGVAKPLAAFHRQKHSKHGRRAKCRVCVNVIRRERDARCTPEEKAQKALALQQWHAAHPSWMPQYKQRTRDHRNTTRRQRHARRTPEEKAAIARTNKAWRLLNAPWLDAYEESRKPRPRLPISPEQYAKQLASNKRYYEIHKHLQRFRDKTTRAKRKHAPIHDLTIQDWHDILTAFDHRCAYCGRKMQRLTQDHLTPLSKGGNHTKSNVVPACRSCNSKKHVGPPLKPVQPLLL